MSVPKTAWKQCKSDQFWNQIAAQSHVLQVYQNEAVFIDALSGFVGAGINAGDCVILIATREHLDELEQRLRAHGVYTETLINDKRYVPLIAESVLSRFMVDGTLDKDRFHVILEEVLGSVRRQNRPIRIFGELVALLWCKGLKEAALQLEGWWEEFLAEQPISLFCAYPHEGFSGTETGVADSICCAHSLQIEGNRKQLTDIFYKTTSAQA